MVLQDDIRARAAANTQKTQYLLTIVAGIFLPLSFITGLLGINVGTFRWPRRALTGSGSSS